MTLPKPYYQDDAVCIYNCDCREILPMLPNVDLVLTDPPYGIGADEAASKNKGNWGWVDYGETNWDRKRPDKQTFEAIILKSDNHIIWGGNYFADYLRPSMGWLAWDKGQRDFSLADFEMAWTSWQRAARCFVYPRALALKDIKQHPTQKPVALMTWCISISENPQIILDPFMGSGTTLRAAKDLGRKAIGIELNERYCEIAARRMSQEVLAL